MRILVCDPFDEEGIEKLRCAGFEVDVNPTISKEDLKKAVADYDVLIVRSRTKVTRDIIDLGERLKVIGRAGAGLDNIDLEAAEKRGVRVLNTPEAVAESVAELTIGLMLSMVRKIPLADRSMKEDRWLKKDVEGGQLRGKTLGLIGLGNVGLKVSKIAKAIGMKILVTKRTPLSPDLLKELEAEFLPLDELLRRSDIVSIHIPLNQQTYKMIGSRELALMKEGAILVNTSRGAIVDERALIEGLKSGRLGGAALDVYESEPPRDLRLIKLPNVVCTPHIGAQTYEAQKDASIMVAEKIIRLLVEPSETREK